MTHHSFMTHSVTTRFWLWSNITVFQTYDQLQEGKILSLLKMHIYRSKKNSNSNNNNQDNVYRVSSWQSHCESSLSSCDEKSTAPGGRWPLDQANQLEQQAHLYRQPVNRIHHHLFLLLLSRKADTHFSVPRRSEWVSSFLTAHQHIKGHSVP